MVRSVRRPTRPGATVVIVGLGNIGSHLGPYLARLSRVACIALVDGDRYEPTNQWAQAITPEAIGESKAYAQADRLGRIDPELGLVTFEAPVQQAPLGLLRGDLICACVDNRAARQYLSQAARRLGVPLVDAGVRADGRLARVSVFPPVEAACLECAWDQTDYDHLEPTYPCAPSGHRAAATNSPAWLGGLAAAHQAAACERVINHLPHVTHGSFETVVDTIHGRQRTTSFRQNPGCRFGEHTPWVVEADAHAPRWLTVGALFDVGALRCRPAASARMSVPGASFVMGLTCLACGLRREAAFIRRGTRVECPPCAACGGRLDATGPDLCDWLEARTVPPALLDRPASTLGLVGGDVVTVVQDGHTSHVQLGEAVA
jgi:molybdopterin/thiamine biosynthesis adenylyltransferase